MNDRKIQFLKPFTLNVKGRNERGEDKWEKVLFGVAEYLMQSVLGSPAAMHRDNHDVTRVVARQVEPWVGREDQEKFALVLSEGQWEKLVKLAEPKAPVDPRYVVAVTDVLQALYNADAVEQQPKPLPSHEASANEN